MRVAILTLPLHTNFGGILQCYALQTVLERMGHKVDVLTHDVSHVSKSVRLHLLLSRLAKTALRKEQRYYGWRTEGEVIMMRTNAFIHKNIHQRHIRSLSSIEENQYDAIVVGSDQIWRPSFYKPIEQAYLSFAKDWSNLRRVAYAASFGTDEWEYTMEETANCASLLGMFDAVSVRETTGIELCREHFNVDAQQVLDPTLLLPSEDYLGLINRRKTPKHNSGIFQYYLDQSEAKLRLTRRLAEAHGLKTFTANNPKTENSDLYFEERIQTSIESWLAGFRDASYVVTDSFHGCVFSIIFNKPFIAIGNVERGMSRFTSLLSLFDLQDRLYDLNSAKAIDTIADIDYSLVQAKLAKLHDTSNSFLKDALT